MIRRARKWMEGLSFGYIDGPYGAVRLNVSQYALSTA